MGVDLVLFVGDFGNEVVEIVREIVVFDIFKVVVFGNYDVWYIVIFWGREKCFYDLI